MKFKDSGKCFNAVKISVDLLVPKISTRVSLYPISAGLMVVARLIVASPASYVYTPTLHRT